MPVQACTCPATPRARWPDSAWIHNSPGAPWRSRGRLFSEFADPAATLLEALDGTVQIHVSTIEEVALDSWVRGHVVLAHCLHDIEPTPHALERFEARRRPRTDWVRVQTRRRDHTRYLPPIVRDNVLRGFGHRIMHANHRPLLDEP